MLIWGVFAGLAALAGGWLVWAWSRPPTVALSAAEADLSVYKAQLAEVDRDHARGVIGTTEAGQLRTEIARRILDLDRAARGGDGGAVARAGGVAAPAGAVAVAVAGAVAVYAWLGAPSYPDLPHADRIAAAEALRDARPTQAAAETAAAKVRAPAPAPDPVYAGLMEKLRTAVAERPGDVEGLRLLVRNERTLGNLSAAAAAQAQLVKALGDGAGANDYAALADAYVMAAGGAVTAEAEAAITAALRRDPRNGTARFYAGLLAAQTGRPDLAFPLWRGLLEEGPEDAPWVPFIRDRIGPLAAAAGVDYAAPDGVAEADDQAEMIRGMVGGLESRLMAEGGPAEEWARLVRALGVLGEAARTEAAWAAAKAALKDDPGGLALVRAEAQAAGVAE